MRKHLVAIATITCVLSWPNKSVAQETTCFASLQRSDRELAAAFGIEPNEVIGKIQASLGAGGPPDGGSRAHLFAMLADAYGVRGDSAAARDAALSGLAALTANDEEPLRHRLNLSSIYYLGEMGQLAKAADEYEANAALVPDNAPDLACVLEIRGYMRMRGHRIVEAATDLVHAAQLAKERGSERYKLDAESVLSLLYAQYGLYDDAHALVADALAASLRADDKIDMANAYFRRGDVYLLQGDFPAAEADFRRSAEISRNIGQPSIAAQADERLCTSLAGTMSYDNAREACQTAIRETTGARDLESSKLAYGGLGQVELGDNHLRLALSYLNRALMPSGGDLPRQQIAKFRKLRGQVRAKLGDKAGALEDTSAYVAWVETDGNSHMVAQMAMARAKFDAAIAEQRLGRARAEADAAKLLAVRERLVANIFMLATALIITAGTSGWWLWRRRRDIAGIRQAAEVRFATIGRLTAGIAHEFNNQLTVLQHGLGLLERRPAVGADPTSQMLIGELHQSARTSATITAQLKSFGRQQHLSPQSIGVDSFFTRVKSTLATAASDRVRLRFDVSSPAPAIYADDRPLTEALVNLVGNARDAMPDGGVVTIQAEPDSNLFTIIRVIDEGVGMSAEILARASEPFFTTKPVGSGTGLGLSMVEGFVTQSGGSMTISSAPQRGTTVTLRLPAVGAQS